jgi:hypothetical protein
VSHKKEQREERCSFYIHTSTHTHYGHRNVRMNIRKTLIIQNNWWLLEHTYRYNGILCVRTSDLWTVAGRLLLSHASNTTQRRNTFLPIDSTDKAHDPISWQVNTVLPSAQNQSAFGVCMNLDYRYDKNGLGRTFWREEEFLLQTSTAPAFYEIAVYGRLP